MTQQTEEKNINKSLEQNPKKSSIKLEVSKQVAKTETKIDQAQEEARIFELAEQTAKSKIQQRKAGTAGRYEIRREQLRENVEAEDKKPLKDQETFSNLNSINPQQKIETIEAKKSLESFKAVSLTLIPKLLENNFSLTEINTLEKISKLSPSEAILSKLNNLEKIGFKKLLEISKETESFYYKELNKNWESIVKSLNNFKPAIDYGRNFFTSPSNSAGLAITEASPVPSSTKSPEPTAATSLSSPLNPKQTPNSNKPAENKGILDSVKEFTSNHSSLILGIIGLAGAYGVYRLWTAHSKSDESDSEKSESDGPLDKFFNITDKLKYPLLLGVSGLFIAGALVGPEGMIKWIKDKLPNISWDSIKDFFDLLVHGHPIDAVQSLFSTPDENTHTHEEIGKLIKKETTNEVKKTTLQRIGTKKLSELMSGKNGKSSTEIAEKMLKELKDKAKGALGSSLKDIPLIGSTLAGFLNSDTSSEDVAEINTIVTFLNNHTADFQGKSLDTLTVNDAFKLILHLPVTPTPPGPGNHPVTPPEHPPYNPDQKIEIAEANQSRAEIKMALNAILVRVDTDKKKGVIQEFMQEVDQIWLEASEINQIIQVAEQNKLTTTEIKKNLQERTEKLNKLLEMARAASQTGPGINPNDQITNFAKAAEDALESNKKVGDNLEELKKETMKKTDWKEAKYLAVVQAPFFFTRYLRTPKTYREYAKYLVGKYVGGSVTSAIEIGKDTYSKITKPDVTLSELETEIKALEEAQRKLQESKKKYFSQDGTALEPANEFEKLQKNHDLGHAELIEQDLDIAKKTHALKIKENELTRLKTSSPTDEKIKSTEVAIAEEKATLDSLKTNRANLKSKELNAKINYEHYSMKERIGTGKNVGEIHKADFERMDNMVAEIDDHRRNLQEEIANRYAKAQKLPAGSIEQKKLVQEIVHLEQTSIEFNIRAFDTTESVHKKWRTDWDNFWTLFGKEETPEARKYLQSEQAKMKSWFNHVLGTASNNASAEKAATKPIINTFKGNVVFYTAMLGAGTYLNYDPQHGGDAWSSLKQTAIDIMPVTGTLSDFYSMWEGKEYFTGQTLGAGDKAIRGVLGFSGALCDIASVAGIGLLGKRALMAIKETKAAGKSIAMKELLEAARAEGKTIDNLEAIKFMKETGKWGFKVGLAGALGLAGYSIMYQPVASRSLSPETQALLSDQIQETNLEPPKISSPFQTQS